MGIRYMELKSVTLESHIKNTFPLFIKVMKCVANPQNVYLEMFGNVKTISWTPLCL